MTEEEKKILVEYKANGLPGLVKIEDSDVHQWFKLYMTGHTYSEISQITKKKKGMILYVAEHNKWSLKKTDYFNDLAMHFVDKSREAKLESANTLVLVNSALSKFITEELQNYIKTGDKSIIENFDTKTFQNLVKAIETLNKLTGGGGAGLPQIDINLSGGTASELKERPEGIEITTKAENGDTLSLLAHYKKAQNSK